MRFKANLLTLPFFRNWNFLAYSMDCSNNLYHLIKGWWKRFVFFLAQALLYVSWTFLYCSIRFGSSPFWKHRKNGSIYSIDHHFCILVPHRLLCCPSEWVSEWLSVTIESELTTNSADFDPIFPDPWDVPGDQGFLQSMLQMCCLVTFPGPA